MPSGFDMTSYLRNTCDNQAVRHAKSNPFKATLEASAMYRRENLITAFQQAWAEISHERLSAEPRPTKVQFSSTSSGSRLIDPLARTVSSYVLPSSGIKM